MWQIWQGGRQAGGLEGPFSSSISGSNFLGSNCKAYPATVLRFCELVHLLVYWKWISGKLLHQCNEFILESKICTIWKLQWYCWAHLNVACQNTWEDRGQLSWNLFCINLSKYVMAGRPEKIGKHTCCTSRGAGTRGECQPTSELTLDNAGRGKNWECLSLCNVRNALQCEGKMGGGMQQLVLARGENSHPRRTDPLS